MSIPQRKTVTDNELLMQFKPIELEEMDSVKLMNRIDTKYVTDTLTLDAVLNDASGYDYRIFETGGCRLNQYDSIYFDTDSLKMYTEHRRGKLVRQKIRTRKYVQSGLCFLEVKRKNNHGRTKKRRIEIAADLFDNFTEDKAASIWLSENADYTVRELSPSLRTSFCRITLVNRELSERLTIDTSVSFKNFRSGSVADLGDAVIIELKRDGHSRSKMQDVFLRHRIKPAHISKYCIGTALTDSSILPGRFKQKVRMIDKLNKNYYLKCYRPTLFLPL